MTQVGYVAYQLMRLCERNTLRSSPVLIYDQSKVRGKNKFDLIRPRITGMVSHHLRNIFPEKLRSVFLYLGISATKRIFKLLSEVFGVQI